MAFGDKLSGAWQRFTSGNAIKGLLDGTTVGNSVGSLVGITLGGIAGFVFGGLGATILLGIAIGAACGIAGGAVVGCLKGAKKNVLHSPSHTSPQVNDSHAVPEPALASGLTLQSADMKPEKSFKSDMSTKTPSQRFAEVVSAQRQLSSQERSL